MRKLVDLMAPLLFAVSLVFFSVAYGMWAWEKNWFPAPAVKEAILGWATLTEDEDKKLLQAELERLAEVVPIIEPARMQQGLTLITAKARILKAAVIDASGEPVQEWAIDWKRLWPDATHLPQKDIPKRRPGTHIHGAVLMPDGDLIFNFEHLGMMRLNPCNEVVWRLPYRTHHSIHKDNEGNLWASGQRDHIKLLPSVPNHKPPFIEPTIVKISPEGELLLEKSVMELLIDNGLRGLLHLQGMNSFITDTTGDTLHLNDVETFDLAASDGVFAAGDVMISLRNINSVLIFDRDWTLKYHWIDDFVRQHDPDFIDANRVSLYDNNLIGMPPGEQSSRILIRDFSDDTQITYFEGTPEQPFYSFIMGKHQWLDNGNVLISETTASRAFELDPQGDVVWEYYHRDEGGKPNLIEEATRLPAHFTAQLFEERRLACE